MYFWCTIGVVDVCEGDVGGAMFEEGHAAAIHVDNPSENMAVHTTYHTRVTIKSLKWASGDHVRGQLARIKY